MKKKKIAFIQSRMGSTRLPGKSMMDICGEPLLFRVIERVRAVEGFNDIVVANSIEDEDVPIFEYCNGKEISCFRGSKVNVFNRFYEAAVEYGADFILRVCGDNPLISYEVIEAVIRDIEKGENDFVSGKSLPLGCSSEGLIFSSLEHIHKNASKEHHRKHIVTYVIEIKIKYIEPPEFLQRPDLRFTVDTSEDLQFVREIYKELY